MEFNLNKYFDPTEPTERWKIRKSFMETHKHKYSEDRLVCLAQVFCNIEFMGCSYNFELMALIQDLANQVDDVIKYRQQKKSAIKRTFVQASDAVKRKHESTCNDTKQLQTDNEKSIKGIFETSGETNNLHDAALLSKAKRQPGWKGHIVIFEDAECILSAYATCNNACMKAGLFMKVVKTGQKKDLFREYALLIGTDCLELCYAENDKKAREELGPKALNLIRKYCFTVVIKNKFEGENIERKFKNQEETSFTLPEDNIGTKMMKLMGWSGQGLGTRENGIKNPIEVQENVHKLGLGSNNCKNVPAHIRKCLENYVSQQHTHTLIFSSEFTNEERKCIHGVARRLNLQSKSHGKGTNRQLTVQRKLSSWEIVEILLAAGGSNNKYDLIKPTNL